MLLHNAPTPKRFDTAPDKISWDQYPAKSEPWKSVKQHALETAAVMMALREKIPAFQRLLPLEAVFFALTHDCGKISSAFLNQDAFRDWATGRLGKNALNAASRTRHEVISESALRQFMASRPDHAECIAGWHHGRRNADVAATYGAPEWDRARRQMLEAAATHIPCPQATLPAWQQIVCAGILCVADWIASDAGNFVGRQNDATVTALLPEADAILDRLDMASPPLDTGLSFEDIFGFSPNPMQRSFAAEVTAPGIYILETVMGAGKTEAALYAAYRLLARGIHHGIYFALPTRLTSNRIHLRVNDFLQKLYHGKRGARLMHGSAFLQPGGGEFAVGGEWFSPGKRGLLYPFGVGTLDQALLGVLNLKHFFVRLTGLAGKVIVIDEAHTYDFFTGFLLDKLCQVLNELGCTVIILSATLGNRRRQEILGTAVGSEHYPLLSFRRKDEIRELPLAPPPETRFQLERIPPEEVPGKALELVRMGANVLLMANTVAEAQQYYRLLMSLRREDEFPLGLLHSNFPQFRREQLECQWVEALGKPRPHGPRRPDGSILIATQILEQSVDIDADILISELAPSDLMLQRLGRVWRHRRDARPVPAPRLIWIDRQLSECPDAGKFKAAAGPAARVYHPYVLFRTHQLWRQQQEIVLPTDLRRLIAATYIEPQPNDPPFVAEFHQALCRERDRRRQRAAAVSRDGLYVASLPQDQDDETAATRYQDQPRQMVVLCRSCRDFSSRLEVQLLDGECVELHSTEPFRLEIYRALYRNSVSLARYRLPDAWLNAQVPPGWQRYSPRGDLLPLLVEANGQITSFQQSHPDAELFYTDEAGIFKPEMPKHNGGEEIELDW